MAIDKGRFNWFAQLSDTPAKAQRFYTEVLPWTVDAVDMGGDEPYPMIKAGTTAVGGFAKLPEGVKQPHWISYLLVDDVERAAKSVVAAGGKALMDAFDVPTVGRMQPIADPQGAALFIFRPASDEGSPKPEGPGTFHWNELWTKDASAALAFYEKAFGFTHEAMEMPTGTYYVLKNGAESRGGIMQSPSKDIPSHWLPYVAVTDLDATLARVGKNGGKSEGDPMEMPGVGRFAFVRDVQGARLGLITPAPRG